MDAEYVPTRGFGSLLRDLANGSTELLRGEVRLVRMELTAITSNVGRGSAQVALGGVMLLLGALSLFAGVILLIGDQWLPRDRYWLAALVVTLLTGALAAFFVRRGVAQLSPSRLAPDETMQTLKEDKEWLKQRLT
ncbi:MAG TPA: phage holin family protein [Gemmatimonadaceae bacterium]|nr:phage holin family protein [Gemmatimonadaceae bacterium]